MRKGSFAAIETTAKLGGPCMAGCKKGFSNIFCDKFAGNVPKHYISVVINISGQFFVFEQFA